MPATSELKSARSKCQSLMDRNVLMDESKRTEALLYKLVESLDEWFTAYKVWEKTDNFKVALEEGRMTARTDDATKVMSFKVTSDSGERREIEIVCGIIGIKNRTIPKNFMNRGKYKERLHALSAVLLDPKGAINTQLFYSGAEIIVFMPLPYSEDLIIYNDLKTICSMIWRVRGLKVRLERSRRQMTRVYFASEQDMASTYYDISENDDDDEDEESDRPEPKFRLGVGRRSSPERQSYKNTVLWRKQALNYEKELPEKKGHGELTIKYRQHAGKFPLIANIISDGDTIYNYKETDDMGFNPRRTIDDHGVCT